ncbi:cytochrome P450 family protein [Macrophomina phaseolina]|uniref:Cytochrome P450 family protein n=1 Tax=Macrophomina phaseolina TaxID=35725 RepID=A0ABQ8FVW5_9PEZI|nr:cytochrome P450 family protein [Macrophomina phaseolina]
MLNDIQTGVTGPRLLLGGLALAPLLFLLTCIHRRYLSPLSKYPGPFWASVTDLWLIELHKQYGSVVRLKPNKLSISCPEAFKVIYGAGNNFVKSEFYSPMLGKRPFDLAAQRNERIHGQQRRLVAGAYTLETMKSLEPYVNTTIQVLLDKLREVGAKGQAVDIAYLIQLFAFDVIGEVSFGKRFGYVEALSDFGIFEQIRAALASAARVGEVPWFYQLHQRLASLIGNHLALAARNGSLHDFTLRAIAARRDSGGADDGTPSAGAGEEHHGVMLSKLLDARRSKPQLSESDIGFALTSNVTAGSDTTSISLSAMIYYLLTTPPALQRLLREMRDKVDAGEINRAGIVSQRAVINEGLRLHPALGVLLPRVVPPQGLSFEGKRVPAGTEVGTSAWVIHRDPSIFGPEPDEFRPERWLDEENKHKMHRFFFAFGGGSRTCIGRNIAMLEISKVLPTLFLHFDIKFTNAHDHPKEHYGGLVAFRPFHVVVQQRNVRHTAEA